MSSSDEDPFETDDDDSVDPELFETDTDRSDSEETEPLKAISSKSSTAFKAELGDWSTNKASPDSFQDFLFLSPNELPAETNLSESNFFNTFINDNVISK